MLIFSGFPNPLDTNIIKVLSLNQGKELYMYIFFFYKFLFCNSHTHTCGFLSQTVSLQPINILNFLSSRRLNK